MQLMNPSNVFHAIRLAMIQVRTVIIVLIYYIKGIAKPHFCIFILQYLSFFESNHQNLCVYPSS